MNYGIPVAERQQTTGIAGRIIPAIYWPWYIKRVKKKACRLKVKLNIKTLRSTTLLFSFTKFGRTAGRNGSFDMKANGTSEEKERGGSSLFCGNVQQKARPFDQANKAGFPGACVNMNHRFSMRTCLLPSNHIYSLIKCS